VRLSKILAATLIGVETFIARRTRRSFPNFLTGSLSTPVGYLNRNINFKLVN